MFFGTVSTVQDCVFGKRFAGGDSSPLDARERGGCNEAGAAADGSLGTRRAHFTKCPNRPAVSPQVDYLDRRGRNGKAKRGRPPGRRMQCDWRCGARLTASAMRMHFTRCSRRSWVRMLKNATQARGRSTQGRAVSQRRNGEVLSNTPPFFENCEAPNPCGSRLPPAPPSLTISVWNQSALSAADKRKSPGSASAPACSRRLGAALADCENILFWSRVHFT